MTGTTHGYNLRSKDTKVEHWDESFESFESSSVAPSTPPPRPSARHTGSEDIEVDPSENTDTAEPRAPRPTNTSPPSTPDIPGPRNGTESYGLQGGFTASSDAGEETYRDANRSRRDTSGSDLDDVRSSVQDRRDLDAKRIHYVQKSKLLRAESCMLEQRSKALAHEADELDKWIARQIKEGGTFDDDSELVQVPEPEPEPEHEPEPEPEATMMAIDIENDEAERESVRSHTPTEVFSESEQEAWELLAQHGLI